jgi:hypothetical protein
MTLKATVAAAKTPTVPTPSSPSSPPPPASPVGLAPSYFDSWLDKFEAGLRSILGRHEVQLRRYFLCHAADLAKCSAQQFDIVVRRLEPMGVGFHMKDMLNKTREVGFGNMAPQIALQPGVTAKMWKGLPPKDKQRLNSNTPLPIKLRGKIVVKPPFNMTEKEIRRAISGCNPHWGVLPPSRQDDPRPRPKPRYYTPVAMVRSGASVIVTFRLGDSEFKGRFTSGWAKKFCVFAHAPASAKTRKK